MTTRTEKTDALFKRLSTDHTPTPHVVSEVLSQLMSVWGGPQQFATAFFTEYGKAAPGGVVRARMLGDVLKLFIVQTAALKGSTTAVEQLTDAELQDVLKGFVHAAAPPTEVASGNNG